MFGIDAFSEAPFSTLPGGPNVLVTLTGVASTGAVGSLAHSNTVAVTGNQANGAVGSVALGADLSGVLPLSIKGLKLE